MNEQTKLTILEGLRSVAKFHEDLCAGKDLDTSGAGYAGFLRCTIRLSSCRKWLEFKEYEDPKILAVFDALSSQRKIKIFMVSASRDLHHNDLWIKVEIGRGVRRLMRFACNYEYPEIIYYFDSPMSKAEFKMGGCTITNISQRVSEIRERRDKHFGKVFGTKDFALERRLDREARAEDAALGVALEKLSRTLEKKNSDKNV